jgi:hypothetical protein
MDGPGRARELSVGPTAECRSRDERAWKHSNERTEPRSIGLFLLAMRLPAR